MDAKTAIKDSLAMADMVALGYLTDLNDAELMQRPHPGCNHVNWQIGHLIASEREMMSSIHPGMPALPEGFASQYSRETVGDDDASHFLPKEKLLEIFQTQRAATLAFLEQQTAEQLDEPTGIDYAPTRGALIGLLGAHWLMHCGQWIIVRRMHNKPIVM